MSVRILIEERDARLNGFLKLLLPGEEARWAKASLSDTPEGLQDILIGVCRVRLLRRDNTIVSDLGVHKLYRLREYGDVDDAPKYGGAIEGCWRTLAFHPHFLPTVHAHPDGATQHPALEQFVRRKDEHPLRGEASRVEYRQTDVGNALSNHGIEDDG